ncbi:MAG: diphthine--ammonia ligase [Methanobacteriota archaeon]|nr:MAG: diphthine--ammonia ligase [Euryarchaeota archaeon]
MHRAISSGMQPTALLTMLVEDGSRSRSHGLSTDILRRQAASVGTKLVTRSTSWERYEANFLDAVRELKEEGISVGVFGDIDLEQHREWVDRVCSSIGLKAALPLWKCARHQILQEFISSGFKAAIVSVKDGFLDRSFLGRMLDNALVEEMEEIGIDASGEEGEYHTFVSDGPLFSARVEHSAKGVRFSDGYWFLDLG